MPRRKIVEKNIRKIQRSRGTYMVSIPKEIAKDFSLKERQKVVVSLSRNKKQITIKDWE